jgi:hypothetical protein
MAGDDNVTIRVTADNRVTAPLAEAADSVRKIGEESTKASHKLDDLITHEVALGRITRSSTGSLKDSSGATYKLGNVSDSTRKQINELTGELKRNASAHENLHGEIKESTSLFDRMQKKIEKTKFEAENLTKIFEIFRHPAIAEGVSLIATAIETLAAGGIAAVHDLSPLGSLIAAYPSTMAAGAQAMGVFKLATDGLAGAIQAMTTPGEDPAALAKALYGMSPAAASFAMSVAHLETGPLRTLKFAVQSALFNNLGNSVEEITPLFAMLTPYLTKTATVLASLVRQAAALISSPLFQSKLTGIMQSNVTVLSNLGQAALNLVQALLNVVSAFEPVEREMSGATKSGTAWLALWTSDHEGKMTSYFENAYHILQGLEGALKNILVGFYNIEKDSSVVGNAMQGAFGGIFKQFADWSKSLKGQASIKNYFAQSLPVLQAAGNLLKAIGTAFFEIPESNNLTKMLDTIRTVLLPEIMEFIKNAQGNLGPTIIKLVSALLKFEDALPTGPQLKVLQGVVAMIDGLATGIEKLPGPARTFLAILVSASLAFKAFSLGGKLALAPTKELFGVVGALKKGLAGEEAEGFFGGLGKGIKNTRTGLTNMRAGFADIDSAMVDTGGKWTKVGGLMKSAMMGVVTPIKNAAAATRDFTAATWESFKAQVASAWQTVKDAAAKAWDTTETLALAVANKVQAAAQYVADAAAALFDAIELGPLLLIIGFVVALGAVVYELYKHWHSVVDVLKDVWHGIEWLGKEALNALKEMARPLITYFDLWIKGLNLVIGLYDKIPFSHKIGKIPVIPGGIDGLYAGGQVMPGSRALVGEIGPEAFVNTAGVIKMIGTQGPEVMDFASRGYVVPTSAVEEAAASGVGIAAVAHGLSGGAVGSVGPASMHGGAGGNSTIIHEGSITVPVYSQPGQSASEIANEVARIVERNRRNHRERTSVWARAGKGL